MTTTLNFLCAGASQGVVKSLLPAFEQSHSVTLKGRFGAVGAMKEALLAGEPCDFMIVTDLMIDTLIQSGELRAGSKAALGRVRTGIAVRSGEPQPAVDTAEALKAALLAADAIYFPDPVRATAGIHFANVMRQLGIHDSLQARFKTFPAGAIAMRELAATDAPRLIGCTQVSEILYSEGVQLVGALPPQFELATVYSAAVSAKALQPTLAEQFVQAMTGAASRKLRTDGGIEP
ncbi:MAG: substrate-binding domain-containing protein [Pseudomonadota bacterium]|nr:substrate-binding domain-containing protein [Pseudomonadota bacterium]